MAGVEDPDGASGRVSRLRSGVRLVPLTLIAAASLEPFLGFLNENLHTPLLEVGILAQLAVGTLLVVTVVYGLLLLLFPAVEPARVAAPLAGLVFCFFRYGMLQERAPGATTATLAVWAAATGLVVALIALWSRNESVRLFLVLFLVILAALPTASILTGGSSGGAAEGATPTKREPIEISASRRTPDVWWLVFDHYGRADALEMVQGFDNQPFLTALERRGFRVSDESFTSYPATPLSLSSVLELDHVVTEGTLDEGFGAHTGALRGGGRVVEALREHGYRYLYADAADFNWSSCDEDLVDVCLPDTPSRWTVGRLTRTVSELTPLGELFVMERPDVEWTVDRAQELLDADDPEFVFIHTLSPHDPYWFNADCDLRSRPNESVYDPVLYVNEIRCLNPRILAAVDSIISEDPEAIIIVQADHGASSFDSIFQRFDEWSEDELSDRYSILEAMRFPASCATPVGPHSNVSTFEYVLACIEGREPVPLDDRYFFWIWAHPHEVEEIERPRSLGAHDGS